jgi:hypothetical protein
MNRRSLLSFIASLPIIGSFVKPAAGDGVALRSMSHPCAGALDDDYEPSGIVTSEISLTRYAAAGDQVTCENGHPICEFVVDVAVGQTQDLAVQLGNWTQKPPEIGQMESPLCAVCGADFCRGGVFHFHDGWRRLPGRGFTARRRT